MTELDTTPRLLGLEFVPPAGGCASRNATAGYADLAGPVPVREASEVDLFDPISVVDLIEYVALAHVVAMARRVASFFRIPNDPDVALVPHEARSVNGSRAAVEPTGGFGLDQLSDGAIPDG